MSKICRLGYFVVVECVLMLRDHSNKWKQKHTIFWWKPLRTNHKIASFFYFNSLSSWKWTFPEGLEGLCRTCGNSGGVGGVSVPCKNGKSRRVGGPKRNSLRGGGLDIFWNYTIQCHKLFTGLLIGWGKKWEILRHFQGKLCGKKGLLCGKLCDFFKADLTLFL